MTPKLLFQVMCRSVRFESTKKSYFACLGSPTPIAKSLQKTTNLLSLLL